MSWERKTINNDENVTTARAIIQNWKKYKIGHNHAKFSSQGEDDYEKDGGSAKKHMRGACQ